MAVDENKDYFPEPFPEGLPVVHLERISLAKLMDDDEKESERLFDICCNEGFCYVDLTSHPQGIKLTEEADSIHQVGKEIFATTSMMDKNTFKERPEDVGVFDTGYKAIGLDDEGNPNRVELINISQAGLFSGTEDYHLPFWLAKHETIFRSILENSNIVHNIVLAILEKRLQLSPSTITSLHKLTDRSGDFIRILHYPSPRDGKPLQNILSPAHRDTISVALLFCWQGGFQIRDSKAAVDHTGKELEDTWLYVPPVPGHVLLSLGDAMQTLTNGVLKSGEHRVVSPPGEQGKHDRYSVLVSARPKEDTLMQSFHSPMIPPREQVEENTLTAKAWGMQRVLKALHNMRESHGGPINE